MNQARCHIGMNVTQYSKERDTCHVLLNVTSHSLIIGVSDLISDLTHFRKHFKPEGVSKFVQTLAKLTFYQIWWVTKKEEQLFFGRGKVGLEESLS